MLVITTTGCEKPGWESVKSSPGTDRSGWGSPHVPLGLSGLESALSHSKWGAETWCWGSLHVIEITLQSFNSQKTVFGFCFKFSTLKGSREDAVFIQMGQDSAALPSCLWGSSGVVPFCLKNFLQRCFFGRFYFLFKCVCVSVYTDACGGQK